MSIIYSGICPYCKKSVSFYNGKCRCFGRNVNVDKIIQDE